ncbi:unnamed protein product [Heligmosomoides polygyrus]|uniref:Uncharacterized protein n=1 Tax=Heligmosomoides polygyrus TaxID=6339 RepID=A0A183FLQ9_HELPZ|nr:unnamed protein product [Heligmosomoides polygyrus]
MGGVFKELLNEEFPRRDVQEEQQNRRTYPVPDAGRGSQCHSEDEAREAVRDEVPEAGFINAYLHVCWV